MIAEGDNERDEEDGDSDKGDSDVILPVPPRDPPPCLKCKNTDKNFFFFFHMRFTLAEYKPFRLRISANFFAELGHIVLTFALCRENCSVQGAEKEGALCQCKSSLNAMAKSKQKPDSLSIWPEIPKYMLHVLKKK